MFCPFLSSDSSQILPEFPKGVFLVDQTHQFADRAAFAPCCWHKLVPQVGGSRKGYPQFWGHIAAIECCFSHPLKNMRRATAIPLTWWSAQFNDFQAPQRSFRQLIWFLGRLVFHEVDKTCSWVHALFVRQRSNMKHQEWNKKMKHWVRIGCLNLFDGPTLAYFSWFGGCVNCH